MTAPPAGMRDIRGPVLAQLAEWYEAGRESGPHGPAELLSAIPAAKTWTNLEMLTALAFTGSVLITLARAVDDARAEGLAINPGGFIRACIELLGQEDQ